VANLFTPLPPSKKLFNFGLSAAAFSLSALALIPLLAMLWSIVSKGVSHLTWDVFTQA
jgi:phosphate transport system permease protein